MKKPKEPPTFFIVSTAGLDTGTGSQETDDLIQAEGWITEAIKDPRNISASLYKVQDDTGPVLIGRWSRHQRP